MRILLFIVLFCIVSSTFLIAQNSEKDDPFDSSTFKGLKFRSIGPAFTSGRVTDFAVNHKDASNYFVTAASGGVWKTTNSGTTWKPVFDKEGSYSIGCVTMDPNNHNVVWVGTGENNSQRSVGYGDGIYRTEDGGESWENMGLKNSEHIAKILIDPHNSSVVYAAAQGPLWGPGGDRGLYKTTDAGKTWEAILTISENTGVTDVVMDPGEPDVLYAASYQRRRHVFTLINGGPESAIYKSTDAGATWKKLEKGLPKVDLGRIGLAISPVDPDVIYALIEAADEKGGFFRSTNRGATWKKQSNLNTRSAQYYQEIFCDPFDVDRVYSLDTWTQVTDDGGKTFKRLGNKHRHVDDHAFWIDSNNPNHYLIGGDGGIYETYDRAANWHYKSNLPITQFYKVAVDNAEPFYFVYGGTQDNNSMGGPSRTLSASGIVNSDWFITNGGDGYESQIDPADPNIIYAQSQYGWLVRYDKKSGERMGIKPLEGKDEEPYRWNWDTPLVLSSHSHTRLYFAANKLFKSEDRGSRWEVISPDLSRQLDRNKLQVMGKIWSVDAVAKNASTSQYGNIVALAESPIKEGLLYTGSDDGLIHVSEDDGKNWRKIEKFPGVPEMTYVNSIIASRHDHNRIYACFNNHKNSDFKPYILVSNDKGKSWESIRGNLPGRGSVYSIAEDHVNSNLLFAGTEFGLFFTIDAGKKWVQLKSGLPTIAVRDIDIQKRENDLVLGTFGRGFYILDDYTPLRELTPNLLKNESHLFPIKDALMYIESRPLGKTGKANQGESFFTAENPPFGATFTYYLKDSLQTIKGTRKAKEKELIEKGEAVPFPTFDELRTEDEEESPYLLFTIYDEFNNVVRKLKARGKASINRITWNLRYPSTDPARLKKGEFDEGESGMHVLPGKYKVTLSKSVNGEITQLAGPLEFNAVVLNNTSLPAKDRKELVAFQRQIAELNRAARSTIESAIDLEERIKKIKVALNNTPNASIDLMNQAIKIQTDNTEILRKIKVDKSLSKRNIGTAPSVLDRVEILLYDQWRSTSAPTKTQRDSYKIASEELTVELSKLKTLIEVDLKKLEDAMEDAKAPWTPGRIPEWKGR